MIFLANELTKFHEKYFRKPVRELYEELSNAKTPLRGEITLVLAPYNQEFNDFLRF